MPYNNTFRLYWGFFGDVSLLWLLLSYSWWEKKFGRVLALYRVQEYGHDGMGVSSLAKSIGCNCDLCFFKNVLIY